MKVSVFGLGYVGSVSAACLADKGHTIIGVDPNRLKVDMLGAGKSPVIETELPELLAEAIEKKRLTATQDTRTAVLESELSIICVGTQSQENGSLDTRHLENACREIGQALKEKSDYHVVVVRSTILPGTMRGLVIPALEQASGKKAGEDFGVCNNPEFMREGCSVYDFRNPPKTIIGQTDARAGDKLAELYDGLPGPVIRCPIEVGEMVKYADNAWHAVKVVFANEIGMFCKASGIDSHKVMDIFCSDTKLNLSAAYLRPGFAFGGSCLPKDIRALAYRARQKDLNLPLIGALMPSNREMIEQGIRLILSTGKRKVGLLGFSFKAGTDDLRESPLVEVIERLLGKGLELRLYDRNVNISRLVGANREYILSVIPHIERLMMESIDEVLASCDVIVIGNSSQEFEGIAGKLKAHQQVIDLVRIKPVEDTHADYQGICW